MDEIKFSDKAGQSKTLAYVVMPDHLHWLFSLEKDEPLGQLIQQIKGCTSRRINARCNSSGHIWQAGYHDRAIRKHEDLEPIANYVLLNPVRAGLVKQPEDYPYKYSVWLTNHGRG
jgi:REP element-mobilizing transposase RayT